MKRTRTIHVRIFLRQEEQKIRVLKIIPLSYPVPNFRRIKPVAKQFVLQSSYKPAGDQPGAIDQLVNGIGAGLASQTLLGVTGSGKTFTMANVIQSSSVPLL